MIQLFLLINSFSFVYGDLIKEYYGPPDNFVPIDNIVAGTIWAMGVCSCVGIVCNHKNKNLIKVDPCEHTNYDSGKTESYYKIEQRDKDKLSKIKKDLEDMKKAIISLEYDIEQEEKEKFNLENNIETKIPYWIQNKYGEGLIRLKENGKYYHGITIHDKKKYMEDYNHRFFERLDDKNVNWFLGTKNPNEYCCNCSLDNENTKRRKVYNIYKCNGHDEI
jgi:hypothetical protein